MAILSEPEERMDIPETVRGWAYLAGLVLIAVLIVFDVATGGDAGEWVLWLAAAIGLGETALAAANTPRRRDPE